MLSLIRIRIIDNILAVLYKLNNWTLLAVLSPLFHLLGWGEGGADGEGVVICGQRETSYTQHYPLRVNQNLKEGKKKEKKKMEKKMKDKQRQKQGTRPRDWVMSMFGTWQTGSRQWWHFVTRFICMLLLGYQPGLATALPTDSSGVTYIPDVQKPLGK